MPRPEDIRPKPGTTETPTTKKLKEVSPKKRK